MKVLLIKTAPGEIRIDRLTYNHQEVGIAKALIRRGHSCDIMCCADEEEHVARIDVGDGRHIKLYCVKGITILKNCLLQDTEKIFENYDILQLSEYNQMFTWHAAKKYADKAIVWHGPYYSSFNKRYNAMAKVFDMFFVGRYRRLNTLFLTKSSLATEYLEGKGLTHIRTIGVGIDTETLSDHQNQSLDLIDRVNAATGKKLLYIGKLEPRRNSFFLLEVLNQCLEHGDDVSLVIVGSGEKDYVERFFGQVTKMGLKDRIIYQDSLEQKHMGKLYASADIFLLPSIYEIFGMVLLEAMYFSKPVITTANGGSSMLIDQGENGIVMDGFDADLWQGKISCLLENPELAERMGRKAHEKIVNEYTWDALADKFLDAYREKKRAESISGN